MSLRRFAVKLLDKHPFRPLLAAAATAYLRHATRADVAVLYDHCWMLRQGNTFYTHGRKFSFYRNALEHTRAAFQKETAISRDAWCYRYTPRPGDTVIDVGAGIGVDTDLFSHAVGPTGRVLAIEAQPDTFNRLRAHCKYNRLKNVICHHAAITDKPGEVRFEDRPQHVSNAVSENGTLSVPADTLDRVCATHNIQHIHFLKMNIEGAERLALAGMQNTLKHTETVGIACHDFKNPNQDPAQTWFNTRDFVIAALQAAGFNVETRPDDPRPPVRDHVHAVRNAAPANPGNHPRSQPNHLHPNQ